LGTTSITGGINESNCASLWLLGNPDVVAEVCDVVVVVVAAVVEAMSDERIGWMGGWMLMLCCASLSSLNVIALFVFYMLILSNIN
jgi:hypothetical protein